MKNLNWTTFKICWVLGAILHLLALVQAHATDFSYITNAGAITITGYTGSGGAVTVPDTINGLPVTHIGDWAFARCRGLTSVTIPSSVTSIGNAAFYGCTGLTNVTIPSSVTSIGDYAFYECGLTNFTIPSSLTSIGHGAFSACSGLTSVTIPSSVTSIGYEAFSDCSGLTAFTVDAQNLNYSSVGGVLFNKAQTTLVQAPGRLAGVYSIPGTVTSIGYRAFAWCSGLTSVTIASSVTSIGDDAFSGCSGLTSVTVPSSVTSIGSGAFSMCGGLTNVTIPSSVTSIGGGAFWVCSGLTSVIIPSSVTSIGDEAFSWCSSLTSAYFQGNAPSSFGDYVFSLAAPQFSIYYPTGASGWSTPTWHGYPAQPYNYTPPAPPPLLSLTLGAGAVTPSFSSLVAGTNYQLQVSTNLQTWSNSGPGFSATNMSGVYSQPFYVTNANRLFFRLVTAP